MKAPHLTTISNVTRNNILRAYKMNDPNVPKYDGTPASLHEIIAYLNVEKSARYQPNPKQTFCNIYAYDYATLCGAYLPRVWWNEPCLKRILDGIDVPVLYPSVSSPGTIIEMNANAIYDWFKVHSSKFGWRYIESKTEAQSLANSGKCVIMTGANLNRGSSGHITAIVPETDKFKCISAGGIANVKTVMTPLQSQAGRTCWKYKAYDWQKGHQKINIYVHDIF